MPEQRLPGMNVLNNTQEKTSVFFGLAILLVVLAALEILSVIVGGRLTGITAYLWILQYLFVFFVGFKLFADVLRKALQGETDYFFLLIHGVLLFMLLFPIGNISLADISYESALQTAAGLHGYTQNDLNYHGVAFLNYPARQYLIVALPSLLLGKSTWALHFGYAQLVLTGYFYMAAGLARLTAGKGLHVRLSLLPLLFLFATPVVGEFYLVFEQTILPLALAMILTGGLLLSAANTSEPIAAFVLAWAGAACAYFYTPAIALLPVVAYYLFHRIRSAEKTTIPGMVLYSVVAYIAVFVLLSFVAGEGRGDGVTDAALGFSPVQAASTVWGLLENDSAGLYGWFGLLNIPIIAYLLLSFVYGNGKTHWLFSWWLILVVFASVFIKGHLVFDYRYQIAFRTLFIFPFLYVAFYCALERWFKNRSWLHKNNLFNFVVLFLILLSVINIRSDRKYINYMNIVLPAKHLIWNVHEEFKKRDERDYKLVVFTSEGSLLANIYDYTAYFASDVDVKINPDREELKKWQSEGAVLEYAASEKADYVPDTRGFEKVSTKDWRSGRNVFFYRKPSQTQALPPDATIKKLNEIERKLELLLKKE